MVKDRLSILAGFAGVIFLAALATHRPGQLEHSLALFILEKGFIVIAHAVHDFGPPFGQASDALAALWRQSIA